jgi:putative membrane protein
VAQFLPQFMLKLKQMKKLIIPIFACFAIACGNDDNEQDSVEMAKEQNQSLDSSKSTSPSELSAEHNFLVEAYSGTKMEIQLGNYAASNAGSSAVKEFGRMMVQDHTKSDSAITVIARVKAIVIPNVPGNDHQQHIDELTKKKGAEFDKDYMKMMVEDHEEDIEKFEEASKTALDEDIRKFAANTLPVLRKHLDAAKKLKEGLK